MTTRASLAELLVDPGESRSGLADKPKFEAVEILRKAGVPCAPVLSMKEIANDPSRASGMSKL